MNKKTPDFLADYPDILSVEELSSILDISIKTAYKLLKDKKIKFITIGRIYKIPKVHLLEFLNVST